jgi:hypothetical protein
MMRLPEEITKGKAVTYKLVKLKKSVSYYDSKIRETQKFTHAISICDIPFLYLYESKAKDGRRGLYFSSAKGVGQNIQYNAWWTDSRSEPTGDIERRWVHSDFPAVNYGVEVKKGFEATMLTDDKRWPNAFWKKAFGVFTRTVSVEDKVPKPMTFVDVFFMSCQCFTTLVLNNKCLYSIMETSIGREEAVSTLANHAILTPQLGGGIEVNVMKLLKQGEHTTHIRGRMSDMKAWVHLINTLSLKEYDDKTFGIVNMNVFDTDLSLKEYYDGLTHTQKTNFNKGAMMNLQRRWDGDKWVGDMLSPANTLCDEDNGWGWGGFSTADESKRRYGLMMSDVRSENPMG